LHEVHAARGNDVPRVWPPQTKLRSRRPQRPTAPPTPNPPSPSRSCSPTDTIKKLKVVAIVKETSVSELVAEAAAGVVKRELKKALSKISGE
jgi:hypothetical protein